MKKEDKDNMEIRIVNTLAVLTTKAVTQTLFNYLGFVNVAVEDRPQINMKNEFYYSTVITTFAKKSYVGLQLRQEGVVFKEPVLDVKGVNFFKSTASEETSKFIYEKILMEQLLQPKGQPSLKETYKAIYKFQKRITKEIAEGNMGYLKRSIKVKSPDGYANPMRIGQYKAVYVWNKIVPDKDRIDLPATVTLVKVKLKNLQEAGPLASWPEIYERVVWLFENDDEIGDYVDEDGTKKKGKGINTIAIPETLDEVPEWILSIIDVETLVDDNMKLFSQIFKPLGLTQGTTASGASRKYYTSIVRL